MFRFRNGKRITKSQQTEGNIPYITGGSRNNGITDYIGNPAFTERNIITFNFFGEVYYQPDEVGFKDGTYSMTLLDSVNMNKGVSLYVVAILGKIFKQIPNGYDMWITPSRVEVIEIELPILSPEDTEPYWDYMAYFIHNIQQQYADKLEAKSEYELDLMCQLLGVTREDIKERVPYIEPKYTNKFTVGELFVINRGDISNQGNLVETGVKEGVAFIAQNDSNNGYVKQVEPERYKVYQGRNIVIGRQTGAVYYQDEEFVTTDGVLVLSSKHILDKEIGWYLVTIIKKHLGHSGYNNTVSATKLNKIELELPVIAPNSKQIDWGAIRHAAVGGGGSTIWLLVWRYATEILR